MGINFTFLHMTDVKKSEISFIVCTIYGICCILHCFVTKFVFWVIYAVLLQNRFVAIYALLCGENFIKK